MLIKANCEHLGTCGIHGCAFYMISLDLAIDAPPVDCAAELERLAAGLRRLSEW